MLRDIRLSEEGQRVMEQVSEPSPNCLKCTHFKMCKVIDRTTASISQLFLNIDDIKELPFDPNDIAKICQWYDLDSDR